jgi:hypothetical protein
MEENPLYPNPTDFRVGTVAPVECFKEGWELIKDRYWLFFGLTLVGVLIGNAFAIVLWGPMACGLYLCFFQQQRRENVEFGTLFRGFDYFLPAFLVELIKSIPTIVITIPYVIAVIGITFANMPRRGEPSDFYPASIFGLEIVYFLILTILKLLVEVFFLFAFPLVVDRQLSAVDALKLSLRASKANLGGVVGLLLLNAVFSFVAFLCCFVGLYFYMPISFAAYAVAYRRVFPDIGQLGQYPPPPPPQSWAA